MQQLVTGLTHYWVSIRAHGGLYIVRLSYVISVLIQNVLFSRIQFLCVDKLVLVNNMSMYKLIKAYHQMSLFSTA